MSELNIYNSLTKKKEVFEPINDNVVNMYVCGITSYDECHLGHARCYVVFDVIRRYLEFTGYNVKYVQNFTDIDDKIIKRAEELKKKPEEVSKEYIERYFDISSKLNLKAADEYPKVTEHIQDIIKRVEKLDFKKITLSPMPFDQNISEEKLIDWFKIVSRGINMAPEVCNLHRLKFNPLEKRKEPTFLLLKNFEEFN